jgi:hypothetical protein
MILDLQGKIKKQTAGLALSLLLVFFNAISKVISKVIS